MKTLMILTALFLVGCTDSKDATVTAKDGVNGKDGQSIVGPKGDKGETGAKGATGVQGLKGDKGDTGAQGPKGEAGASTAGVAGANGKNAVIKQYSATTVQCANGGIVLDTFTDINSNNAYDASIDTNYQRSVLCNQISKCEDKKDSDDDKDKKDEDNY